MDNKYLLFIIILCCKYMIISARNDLIAGLAEFESLIRGKIDEARCQLTCEPIKNDAVEHERCMRVCLTGDYSVCDYDWLCTGRGCQQACLPSVHDFTSTDLQVDSCKLLVPLTKANADVIFIIGARDKSNMWRMVRASFAPGSQLYLKDEDIEKFQSLGVVGVSGAGIVERHNIPLEVFNCATPSQDITNDLDKPKAQFLFQDNVDSEVFDYENDFTMEDSTEKYEIVEENRIFLQQLDNEDINRIVLMLLSALVLVCSCVLLVLFSLYLCRTRRQNSNPGGHDDTTTVDSDSVHFLENGAANKAASERLTFNESSRVPVIESKVVNYEEIEEA